MRKIAILKGKNHEIYTSYEDDYNRKFIAERITDFTEVDDETYYLLYSNQHNCGYVVLEQVINVDEFIADTVQGYLEKVKKQQEKYAKEKVEAERIKKEKAEKRKLKTAEKEIKMLQELIQKHGTEINK